MSRDGQSLGKKIMGIRVLKSDGNNPGFEGTVLIREVVWALAVGVVVTIVSLAISDTGGNLTRPPHALRYAGRYGCRQIAAAPINRFF